MRLPESDVKEQSYVRATKFNNNTIERAFTIENNHIVHQFEYEMPLWGSATTSYATNVTTVFKLERKMSRSTH